MRKFTYEHNGGAEYFMSVLSESNELLTKISFPTPPAIKEFFQRDINRFLESKNLPLLSSEEIAACKKIIDDNLPN